ncbi:MAG TPA: phosphate propanoyltransferase, partial [Bacillota bacterium]|nr:phosphate propanoyltransferase [Bacillota bacterium]
MDKSEALNTAEHKKTNKWLVSVGVSRTHVHLTRAHVEALFGSGYQLTVLRELGQAGQFACKETVNVVGSKGVLQNVRIIGPERPQSQVELSRTETFTTGIDAPLRDSGDLENTPGCVLIGPKGVVVLDSGVIIARAHIHLRADQAARLEINDKDKVSILVTGEKKVAYHDVLVRLVQEGMTEFHVDTDEANAAFMDTGDVAMISHKEILVRDEYGNVVEVDADDVAFVRGKSPGDYYTQEGIRLLRNVFDYSLEVGQDITHKLMVPQGIEPNKFYLLTAVEHDKVIGIACFYYLPDVKLGYFEHLGIIPGYKGRGLGSFFFHKVVSFLEKEHPEVEGILLEVRKDKPDLDNR